MRYSSFRADTGDYDVFEAPSERRGLADDMPVPPLVAASPIGVASTDVGRTPSSGLRYVGRSALPVGAIMPLSRAGLKPLGSSDGFWVGMPWYVWLALGVGVGWYWRSR
jgi:hypothetical protein